MNRKMSNAHEEENPIFKKYQVTAIFNLGDSKNIPYIITKA